MITATEFHLREPLPLHRVQEAILEFCRGRQDVMVFGAQAVNVHVDTPRMTQDVDLLSTSPAEVAALLRSHLADRFHAAIRVRELVPGVAFRVHQARENVDRALADVRRADFALDEAMVRDEIRYASLPLITALKVRGLSRRRQSPKGATDLADVRRLLLAHPRLREPGSGVEAALERIGAEPEAHAAWRELIAAPIVSDEESDEGY